ncbi:MAG: hypothetical protein U1E65_14080 [Myxococcota bacterium]
MSTLDRPIALRPPPPAWRVALRFFVIGTAAFYGGALAIAVLIVAKTL